MNKYIIAIDQGTTSSRACLYDHQGQLIAQQSEVFEQYYPQPGWVEHNANEIWSSVVRCLKGIFERSGIQKHEVQALGITNQRETIVAWDAETGEPLAPALVWQCRRTQKDCEKINKSVWAKKIHKITGLYVDPYFSATKMQWLLKNNKSVQERAKNKKLKFGTIDSFLLWKLTSGQVHATDVSNASRTMLMDLKSGQWSAELLKYFKIPKESLPEIKSSNANFGRSTLLETKGIPVHGILGDQQAALFGQVAFLPGESKCTFGTGSFLLLNTGTQLVRSRAKMLSTVAWQIEGQKINYALEGGAFVCGAAVQWLRDGLGLIQNSSEIEKLAQEVEDTAGVQFVPALTGLGAPYWQPEARGVITGLTRGTQRGHLARATLEAMALQNVEILLAMQLDLKKKLRVLKVDGGATKNDLLMQMQSDFLGLPLERPQNIETTSLGAAYMAGLGVGLWSNLQELKKIWQLDHEFLPNSSALKRKQRLIEWQKAVAKA